MLLVLQGQYHFELALRPGIVPVPATFQDLLLKFIVDRTNATLEENKRDLAIALNKYKIQ